MHLAEISAGDVRPLVVSDDVWRAIAGEFNLSPRQLDVVKLRYAGLTRPQIAERLGVSLNTVKKHLNYTHSKLLVTTARQLYEFVLHQCARWAIRNADDGEPARQPA